MERNPLRAGLVEKSEAWRWSSLWIREKGDDERKQLISDWPIDKPVDYLKWVNLLQKDEVEKLEKIRLSIQRSRPFGKNNWVKKTAESLGLISTLRSKGRPKKCT